MSEITFETKNNGNDLPKDIIAKIAQKLGGQIYILEEKQIKSDVLKQPIKFRSYRALTINRANIHTGSQGVKGLMINDETFLHGRNVKMVGAEATNLGGSDKNNNNGGSENQGQTLFIALDEKVARKASYEFNILRREEITGMINSLVKNRELINEIIEADKGTNQD